MSILNTTESAPMMLLSSEVIREAERHLSQSDSVMAQLVSKYRALRDEDFAFPPFHVLVSTIISQLVTTAAAESIENQVVKVVNDFCPAGFLAAPIEELRKAGLSKQKAAYIIEAARRVTGRIFLPKLRLSTRYRCPDRLPNLSLCICCQWCRS